MSATETQTPAGTSAENRSAETADEFLRPTLVGIGIGTASVSLLAMLLLLLALAADIGGRAAGNEGAGAGRGTGDGFGSFAATESGGGETPSNTDTIPGANNSAPAEISTQTAAADADERPQTAATAVDPDRDADADGLSSFTIASLPDPTSGDEQESNGAGSGFSDVGERLAQAGAKTGDVQISLAWNNVNDLDLHVITPSGERIFFRHRKSACHGELDVDMNAVSPDTDRPVENVYWPVGQAPQGDYRVQLHYYANHGATDPTKYQVVVKAGGRTQTFTGEVSHNGGQPIDIHHFTR